MSSTIHFYCILGSYIGCSLFLTTAFITINDLFDEIAEFRERVETDLIDFTKYANDVSKTMELRPRMTERAVFDAVVRLKRRVTFAECCKISHF